MKSISLLHIMNRITKYFFGSVALFSMSACNNSYVQPDAPIKEVPFTQVHLDDNFWTPRIETNRTVSIPSAFKECEKNGRNSTIGFNAWSPEVIIQVDLSKGNFFYRCIGLNIRVVTSTHTKKGNTTEKVFSYSIHNM